MSDEPDGRIKPPDADRMVDTQDEENGRAESWQAGPSTNLTSNVNNERHIHKRTARRTGLRATDDHASWRAVYYQCHVGVGMNE